jgi:NitT/TauT family transport system permease protein
MSLATFCAAVTVFGVAATIAGFVVLDLIGKANFFRYFEYLGRRQRVFYAILSFVGLGGLWIFLHSSGIVEERFLPGLGETLGALLKSIGSGELVANIGVSLMRIGIGFLLASVVGVFLGSIAGTFERLHYLILPPNSALRYIPPTAFIGLTIIWFGIGEAGKISLIFIAVLFFIIQMTADAVAMVPRVYVEAAMMLGAGRLEIFRRVILGWSLSDILGVLRVNLGAAWTFLIVAELVAAQSGLGYLMAVSQRFLQTSRLFALLIVVGFLGFASDAILAVVIRRVARWK